MNKETLFNEFPPVTTEEWETVINKDLKGADYEKKLVWRTDEGFNVRPYYRAEDLDNLQYLNVLPDQFPYTRGAKKDNNNWEIVQNVDEPNVIKANTIAVDALNKGANSIAFNVSEIKDYFDLKTLLKGVDLEVVSIQFAHSPNYIELMRLFIEYINENKYNLDNIRGSINFDPIIYRLKWGKFYHSKEEDLQQAVELHELTANLPHFKVINVNGLAMHNAGASLVQELAWTLGIANEYLAFLTSNNITIENAARKMKITLSVGSKYFMEIAKLRATRLLWSTMVEQYHPKCNCAYKLQISTVASTWNKTLYDTYVNMLRSTTEGMAAAIGGSDSISLQPFDVAFKDADDFSRRISRNTQIILKEESYFNKVVDPAAGSYYIENLTNSIAEQTWNMFKDVEAEGGILTIIENGTVKAEIEKSCQKRDMDIATRKYIFLGTNQYPNTLEQMLPKVERLKCCKATNLKAYRGAMAFEEIRLETEEYASKKECPKVFLLKIGNLAMRQARAGFITNFFGCAGYQIIDNSGFKTVNEAVEAANTSKAQVVCICSSDEEYATLGIEVAQQLKKLNNNTIIVVAGNPVNDIQALTNVGVSDFIHVKTNVLQTLQKYNNLLLK